jgi:hypothetical protein
MLVSPKQSYLIDDRDPVFERASIPVITPWTIPGKDIGTAR